MTDTIINSILITYNGNNATLRIFSFISHSYCMQPNFVTDTRRTSIHIHSNHIQMAHKTDATNN